MFFPPFFSSFFSSGNGGHKPETKSVFGCYFVLPVLKTTARQHNERVRVCVRACVLVHACLCVYVCVCVRVRACGEGSWVFASTALVVSSMDEVYLTGYSE